MSLEATLQENTNVMRELIAALTAAGALQTAQASAAAASSPAVQAVVKAQKAADAKKPEAKATPAAPAEAAPAASGEQSAPTGESSSSEPMPWAEKTAAKFAELKDAAPDLDNVRKAVLAINAIIGREQATAVLGRFGVQAVTPKDNKKGLDESQYEDFFTLCLEVLAGKVDATASLVSE